MKICFVCNEYPPGLHGGIGTMTRVLARALVKAGHEVRVIGVYPSWFGNCDSQEDEGVQVFRLRQREYRFGWIQSRFELFRIIKSWDRSGAIDIVEVPDYEGMAAGWRALRAPVTTRLHGSLAYFANELHRSVAAMDFRLERASLRRTDFVSSVCRYTAEMTEKVFHLPMHSAEILYNPVEAPVAPSQSPRRSDTVVFSGTLTEKKGIVSLIKAWPLVVKEMPQAQLHIFGKDGRIDDGSSMQQFLVSLLNGERPSVHFRGHVGREDLFKTYRTATAAVFPSYAEAFAVAPLESMAVGCPTIVTKRGSGPELLDHGSEGLLVDPDNPAEIAGAILRVMREPVFAGKIGERGSARVRNTFAVDRLVAQNEKFYERCIREFAARKN